MKGHILVREEIFLSEQLGLEEFVNSLELVARRLLDVCEEDKLLGIGIATFGPFSGESKVLGNVAACPALDYFDIRKFFAENFALLFNYGCHLCPRTPRNLVQYAPDHGSFTIRCRRRNRIRNRI